MQDELKKRKVANINFIRRVRIYRGIQHSHRLPVNVQRTRKINYFMDVYFIEIIIFYVLWVGFILLMLAIYSKLCEYVDFPFYISYF